VRRHLWVGLALTLVISAVGAVAGPAWKPRVVDSPLTSESPDTTIGSDATTTPVGTFGISSELHEIELASGISVTVQVRRPVGATGDRPAVVFLHGAGTATHEGFPLQAEQLASAGVVTLVPDKRMDTYTTARRSYVGMAADYQRTVELARTLPGIEGVGLYAESEGAYVAPIMAAEDPGTAFVVLVAAPIVTPREQGAFATDSYLRNVRVPSALYRVIPRALGARLPLGGIDYVDFDPQPYHQRMGQPTLLVHGTGDAAMPIVEGAEQLIADLAVAGNDQWTVRYYAGANHGIKIGDSLAPGFADDLARWIQGLPATATAEPRIAGDQPVQRHGADPVPAPHWFASGNAILVGFAVPLGLLVVGPVSYAVAAVARRVRGRGPLPATMAPGVGRWLAASALGVTGTWVVFAGYIRQVADYAFNYRSNVLFTYGAFATEWVLALGTTVLLAGAGIRVWEQHRAGVRLSGPAAITTGGTLAGVFGLLVVAAYWSGFPDLFGRWIS